jgi:threonine/homoserine/homoserine lactone efflux protein
MGLTCRRRTDRNVAVHPDNPPLFVQIFVPLFFVGFGSLYLFFTDYILDRTIRWLQSRWYRRMMRVIGLLFIVSGPIIGWAMWFHKLS